MPTRGSFARSGARRRRARRMGLGDVSANALPPAWIVGDLFDPPGYVYPDGFTVTEGTTLAEFVATFSQAPPAGAVPWSALTGAEQAVQTPAWVGGPYGLEALSASDLALLYVGLDTPGYPAGFETFWSPNSTSYSNEGWSMDIVGAEPDRVYTPPAATPPTITVRAAPAAPLPPLPPAPIAAAAASAPASPPLVTLSTDDDSDEAAAGETPAAWIAAQPAVGAPIDPSTSGRTVLYPYGWLFAAAAVGGLLWFASPRKRST